MENKAVKTSSDNSTIHSMKQKTIQKEIALEGVGLHTGRPVRMTLKPAPPMHGFRFQRLDLEGQPVIKADVSQVVSTNRGTTLRQGEAQVHTVEHVLAALRGMDLDNVLITMDGPEAPILDGSARLVVEAIREAGIEEQDKEREVFEIEEPISYKDEVTGTELLALPSGKFEITTLVDFNSPVLGQQFASLSSLEDFEKEIAPARTFVFLHEVETLASQGLIKGGDLDNAVVIADRPVSEEELNALAEKLGVEYQGLRVDEAGVLNTTKLLFDNEPARHKLLDVLGDLALVGVSIQGKIVATKPGHFSNVEFAKLLKEKYVAQRRTRGVPKYDPNAKPLYDTCEIMELLPHRYPMLLVDKIIEMSDHHVVGVKNVTMNEAFFQGHFPGNPVFPGVLQIEALAQTGGVLALAGMPDKGNWDTYFLKVNQFKFKKMVKPGDSLILKLELTAPIRRGIVQMYATAYVGKEVVSEGEMTARIVKRTEEK